MRYFSTQGGHETDLFGAMLQGLAPDGNLYVPAELPRFDPGEFTGESVRFADGQGSLGSNMVTGFSQRFCDHTTP